MVAAKLGDRRRAAHLPVMKTVVLLAGLIAATAGPAAAQAYRDPLPWSRGVTADPGYIADRQRLEMDRLRARADANRYEADRNRFESQLTIQDLRARRQPAPAAEPSVRILRSPEEERAAREAATARRETVQGQTGQIDAWLDRGDD